MRVPVSAESVGTDRAFKVSLSVCQVLGMGWYGRYGSVALSMRKGSARLTDDGIEMIRVLH